MKKMMIRVQTVKHFNSDTRFAVFTANIMRKLKRSDTYRDTKDIHTFVGKLMTVYPGDRLFVSAQEQESILYGHEYKIYSYHREEPGTLTEIKTYLNNIPGVGPASVKKILDKYGLNALNEIRTNSNALDFLKISREIINKIQKELIDGINFEKILTFLHMNDLDYRYALQIYQKYNSNALSKMRDNPYALYLDEIIDFKTADALNYKLKYDYNTPFRIKAAVLSYLVMNTETLGSLYVELKDLCDKLPEYLISLKTGYKKKSFTEVEIKNAVNDLEQEHFLISENDGSVVNLYLRANYESEKNITKGILKIMQGVKHFVYDLKNIQDYIDDYEKNTGVTLAQNQRNAVFTALKEPVSILTGGPGTGKTQTLKAIMGGIQALSKNAKIKVCAPTGKAALRVTEVTGMKASTIHRLLGVGQFGSELSEDQLECDYLFIDEFSMVDSILCAKLFRAVCPWTRVVIVGDFEQLPSVGPGLVLRDLIQSEKIPTTKLTEIFRQSGQSNIVRNAYAFINQQPGQPIMLHIDKKPHRSFYFIEKNSATDIQKTLQNSVSKLLNHYGYELDEVKVLTPLHGTEVGTDSLNDILQSSFNPNGEVFERMDGKVFRIGDPVIHLKNDYDLRVFNGETGIIKAFGYDQDKTILVDYPDNKHVWYSMTQIDELDLSYAMTVHKSQGSEFKVAIIVVHELLLSGLSKNLLYTACTRAKEMVILVGSKEALSQGLRKTTLIGRKSNLVPKLKKAI